MAHSQASTQNSKLLPALAGILVRCRDARFCQTVITVTRNNRDAAVIRNVMIQTA